MNFFTNKIVNPAGSSSPSFEEWLAGFLTKQASEAKPGLGQDTGDEPRGQMRGQVINNDNEEGAHSYQEGESVDGKSDQGGNARKDKGGKTDTGEEPEKQSDKESASRKVVKAECGKEMGEANDAGKVTEEHTDASPGDDEHPEPKVKINNDPCYQKGESTDPAKAKGDSKKQPGEPVVGKGASAKAKFEKVAKLDRKKKLHLFAYLSAQRNNTNLPMKSASGTTYKPSLAYVEAMVGEKFANMQDDEKEWFRDFWRVLYPESYVEEMVADR